MTGRSSRGVHKGAYLTLALIGVLMLLLNMHTPLMMDDYDYSFSWATGERLSGVGEIIASQAAHYKLWGGRSVTHFLAQLFLCLGKPVFNVANALMYVFLLAEISVLAAGHAAWKDWRLPLIAHALLFLTVPFFGVAFLWLDGACNYLWGTALALVSLLIARSEREGGLFDTDAGYIALPLCFLAGWTNENTACGVLAAVGLLLVWDLLTGRRVRLWRIAALAAQAAGTALMLLAPGNFARAAEEVSRGFVMEMLYRFAVVSYCFVRYAGAGLVLCAVLLAAARRKRSTINCLWLCVLAGALLLCAYALVGSPQISDRSFTGVIVLVIAAALSVICDMMPVPNKKCVYGACVLSAVLLFAGIYAFISVKAHGAAWQYQLDCIESAAAQGAESVVVSSVPSQSPYTMSILLSQDDAAWPNSTLSKYYGIRIIGQ